MEKKRNSNNKGFSLIEIIVAICIMAVVVTPIMNSFITSARINRDSRKIMSASDCAQSIMEGFSDKNGVNIVNIAKASGNLTSENKLTMLMQGTYNSSSNIKSIPCPVGSLTQREYATADDATFYQMAINFGTNVVADRGVNSTERTLYKAYTMCTNASSLNDAGTPKLKDTDMGGIVFFAFTGIIQDGYNFDAIVICCPAAQTNDDKYYTYRVKLYLFEDSAFNSVMTGGSGTYMVSFDGGIKNNKK